MATKKLAVRLVADLHAQSPREWDNLGTMVCAHRRYNLGDSDGLDKARELIVQHFSEEWLDREGFDLTHVPDVQAALERTGKAILLPLYLYDHSGITMNTTGFHCPWDSGQVGFIFVSKQDVRNEFGWKKLTQGRIQMIQTCLKGEVEVYDQYLTGDVWGFEVVEDGEVTDSCWGFFGSDPLTNGIFDHLADPARALVSAEQFTRIYR